LRFGCGISFMSRIKKSLRDLAQECMLVLSWYYELLGIQILKQG